MTNSRDEVEQATQVGLERKREGYSPEALVLAIDEIVNNLPLARAIVVYVQNTVDHENDSSVERPFSWFSVLMASGFAASCIWLVYYLFRLVGPQVDLLFVLAIVFGQAILLRLAQRGLRLALMSACDGLNEASYPTKLHPLKNATGAVGNLRLKRLRALVLESADRIVAGEKPQTLIAELSDLNLTPSAARGVVVLATINATLRDYVPPYEQRWLGYTLAVVFIITAMISIERIGNKLPEGFQNYAIAVSAWIAGDLAAKPRRRPRSPAG